MCTFIYTIRNTFHQVTIHFFTLFQGFFVVHPLYIQTYLRSIQSQQFSVKQCLITIKYQSKIAYRFVFSANLQYPGFTQFKPFDNIVYYRTRQYRAGQVGQRIKPRKHLLPNGFFACRIVLPFFTQKIVTKYRPQRGLNSLDTRNGHSREFLSIFLIKIERTTSCT